jgi:hypothetical protein
MVLYHLGPTIQQLTELACWIVYSDYYASFDLDEEHAAMRLRGGITNGTSYVICNLTDGNFSGGNSSAFSARRQWQFPFYEVTASVGASIVSVPDACTFEVSLDNGKNWLDPPTVSVTPASFSGSFSSDTRFISATQTIEGDTFVNDILLRMLLINGGYDNFCYLREIVVWGLASLRTAPPDETTMMATTNIDEGIDEGIDESLAAVPTADSINFGDEWWHLAALIIGVVLIILFVVVIVAVTCKDKCKSRKSNNDDDDDDEDNNDDDDEDNNDDDDEDNNDNDDEDNNNNNNNNNNSESRDQLTEEEKHAEIRTALSPNVIQTKSSKNFLTEWYNNKTQKQSTNDVGSKSNSNSNSDNSQNNSVSNNNNYKRSGSSYHGGSSTSRGVRDNNNRGGYGEAAPTIDDSSRDYAYLDQTDDEHDESVDNLLKYLRGDDGEEDAFNNMEATDAEVRLVDSSSDHASGYTSEYTSDDPDDPDSNAPWFLDLEDVAPSTKRMLEDLAQAVDGVAGRIHRHRSSDKESSSYGSSDSEF